MGFLFGVIVLSGQCNFLKNSFILKKNSDIVLLTCVPDTRKLLLVS